MEGLEGRALLSLGVTVFPEPTLSGVPLGTDLVPAPGGDLLFAAGSHLAEVSLTGAVTTLPLIPPVGSQVIDDLVPGPNGVIWFSNHVLAPTPTGYAYQVSDRAPSGAQGRIFNTDPPDSITSGPDGSLWSTFLDSSAQPILRLAPTGQLTPYTVPSIAGFSIGSAGAITTGPDGNIWFGALAVPDAAGAPMVLVLGQITPSGQITWHPVQAVSDRGGSSGGSASPFKIHLAAGPDGNLWVLVANGIAGEVPNAIFRVSTSGAVTRFPLRVHANATLGNLVGGPGQALSFPVTYSRPGGSRRSALGRVTTSGRVSITPIPRVSVPGVGRVNPVVASTLAPGADGNLWYLASLGPSQVPSLVALNPFGRRRGLP